MDIAEMRIKTHEVTDLFDKLVGKWGPCVMATELAGRVGTLADSIMMYEGYRPARTQGPIDLAGDVGDVLFTFLYLAEHYGIDLETAYQSTLLRRRGKLKQQLQDPAP